MHPAVVAWIVVGVVLLLLLLLLVIRELPSIIREVRLLRM